MLTKSNFTEQVTYLKFDRATGQSRGALGVASADVRWLLLGRVITAFPEFACLINL